MRVGRVVAGAAVAFVALAGCGGGTTGAPASKTTVTTSVGGVPSTVTITSPGTTLAFGTSAIVAYNRAGASSTLKVTTSALIRGSIADLVDYQLNAAQKASTPYYLTTAFSNLGSTPIKDSQLLEALNGYTTSGNLATPVIAEGLTRCLHHATWDLTGSSTLTDCVVFLVPAGQALTTITFRANDQQGAVSWRRN